MEVLYDLWVFLVFVVLFASVVAINGVFGGCVMFFSLFFELFVGFIMGGIGVLGDCMRCFGGISICFWIRGAISVGFACLFFYTLGSFVDVVLSVGFLVALSSLFGYSYGCVVILLDLFFFFSVFYAFLIDCVGGVMLLLITCFGFNCDSFGLFLNLGFFFGAVVVLCFSYVCVSISVLSFFAVFFRMLFFGGGKLEFHCCFYEDFVLAIGLFCFMFFFVLYGSSFTDVRELWALSLPVTGDSYDGPSVRYLLFKLDFSIFCLTRLFVVAFFVFVF